MRTSALPLTQDMNSFFNNSFCPSMEVKRKKRSFMLSALWVATKVPLP